MIQLRPQTPDDLGFLRDVYASTREDEVRAAGLSGMARAAFLESQFQAMTRGYKSTFPNADARIVEWEGRPVGRWLLDRSPQEHRLVHVALLPEFRGRGIATALIREAQREAGTAGRPLRLQVFADNRARELYRRLGFVETGDDGLRVRMEWRSESPHH